MLVMKICLTKTNETSSWKNMKINSNLKTIVFIIAIHLMTFEYCILIFERSLIFLMSFTKIMNIVRWKRCLTSFVWNNDDLTCEKTSNISYDIVQNVNWLLNFEKFIEIKCIRLKFELIVINLSSVEISISLRNCLKQIKTINESLLSLIITSNDL